MRNNIELDYKELRRIVKVIIHIARNVTAKRGKNKDLHLYALDKICDEAEEFLVRSYNKQKEN